MRFPTEKEEQHKLQQQHKELQMDAKASFYDSKTAHQTLGSFAIGLRVEREIDGLWFPATIVDVEESKEADDEEEEEEEEEHDDKVTYVIEYDDEENRRESRVLKEELRWVTLCCFVR